MAGIYFHIPFCKSKCTYCDFYKTTVVSTISDLVNGLKNELSLRVDYLDERKINTIYFGGGTPSLLSAMQFRFLLNHCEQLYEVSDDAEITIEANPDDLDEHYLRKIRNAGINRLSIGIQTFSARGLKLMNRRHTPQQAIDAVKAAQDVGFENISVDLIYGIPGMTNEQWQENLDRVFEMNIQHLSAYHLTYHRGTELWDCLKKGSIKEVDENNSVKQFEMLVNTAKEYGFIQYEISNFCLPGYFSKHNTSYWQQTEYIGLGPSAHSYNMNSRQWNVANIEKYINGISNSIIPFEKEELSINDRFNDYVITGLRTMWGIDLSYVENEFGESYHQHLQKSSDKYLHNNQLEIEDNHLKIKYDGIFISDTIMSDLLI
ncbi:MAG: radical SAM family heme chaperone HemW [Prolixibacteraceae bacterium]|nr:radical SAM family heme chaperone HemW [Prolixibacteraceae bacterium]